MDRKMEMFLEPQRVSDVIQHGADKLFPRETLTIFSNPIGRIIVADAIIEDRYKIMPPKIIQIPKKNSTEMRKVYANTPLDRFVLALINNVYYELYKHLIHPACVSYQKGIGVRHIIHNITSKLSDNMSGYKVDLSKYFDSVNRETVDEYLKMMNTSSPLDKVLWEYYHEDVVIDEEGKTISKYKSLAQGCAFGTLLANMVLRDIDEALSNMEILYYRYSDDLLILGPAADNAMQMLEMMLQPKGLQLNPRKICRIDANKSFVFLGFEICGTRVSLSADSFNNFKKEIRKITKKQKSASNDCRFEQKRAIRKINAYLYNDYLNNPAKFGWMEYFATISNDVDQIRMLDEFTKDRVKALFTGKYNHTRNMHKTSNEQLEHMGYRSMVHMYKLRRINKNVYEAELLR